MTKTRLTEQEQLDLVKDFIEVELKEGVELKHVANELKFIGIINKNNTKLSQTAHILQKRGKYYIVHFKQLLALDGREVDYTDEDKTRLHWIAQTLSDNNPENTDALYTIKSGYDNAIDFNSMKEPLVTRIYAKTFNINGTLRWINSSGLTLHSLYHFD